VTAEEVRAGRLSSFRRDSCKFLTEEIAGSQKYNFAVEIFPQNGGFLILNFVLPQFLYF